MQESVNQKLVDIALTEVGQGAFSSEDMVEHLAQVSEAAKFLDSVAFPAFTAFTNPGRYVEYKRLPNAYVALSVVALAYAIQALEGTTTQEQVQEQRDRMFQALRAAFLNSPDAQSSLDLIQSSIEEVRAEWSTRH